MTSVSTGRKRLLLALALPFVLAAPLVLPGVLELPQDRLDAAEPESPRWSVEAATDLRNAIGGARLHGLDPVDYGADRLEASIAAGPGPKLDMAADESAMTLARDYARGHVTKRANHQWHIESGGVSDLALGAGLARARQEGRVSAWLASLLPQSRAYVGLVQALASTPASDAALRARLVANLERWRWMPRQLGPDAIWVNVPTYRLRLIRDGVPVAEHDVVVGAAKTPTPQISAEASSVTVNPYWTVPPSVLKEQKRFGRGYTTIQTKHGPRIRQAPGPRNALGKVKFEMGNPYAIYLHDTPAKALFGRSKRALSHGCIRVKDVDALAASLTDPAEFAEAYADNDTDAVPLEKKLPVYIVYFTAEVVNGRLVLHDDVYGRDARLATALGVKAPQEPIEKVVDS